MLSKLLVKSRVGSQMCQLVLTYNLLSAPFISPVTTWVREYSLEPDTSVLIASTYRPDWPRHEYV